MPTVPVPPSARTHSWSLVYLRSVGYMSAPGRPEGLLLLLPLIKRHRHDGGLHAAAAYVDLELGPRVGTIGGQIRHPDRFLQERRLGAARHDARLPAIHVGVVAVPADRALEHL